MLVCKDNTHSDKIASELYKYSNTVPLRNTINGYSKSAYLLVRDTHIM